MTTIRDARLGRIALPTVFDAIKEAVGDSLEAVGAGVVPGERRPRSVDLALPLHGNQGEADPFYTGERLRRQMRALMENGPARLQGLYFRFDQDAEQNGWLVIGSGDIAYGEGGLEQADFKLELSDVFRVAKLRTHRPARRLELYDRTVSTTPRDILGVSFGTDFAGLIGYKLGLHFLPVNAYDLLGAGRRIVGVGSRTTLGDRRLRVVSNATHGEVVSFEYTEADMSGADEVVIYDRRNKGDSPSIFAEVALNERPVAYFRHDESPGATVMKDASRSRLDGEYVNNPVLGMAGLTGDGDGAATFTPTRYARTADAPPLDITGDLSLVQAYSPEAVSWLQRNVLGKAGSFETAGYFALYSPYGSSGAGDGAITSSHITNDAQVNAGSASGQWSRTIGTANGYLYVMYGGTYPLLTSDRVTLRVSYKITASPSASTLPRLRIRCYNGATYLTAIQVATGTAQGAGGWNTLEGTILASALPGGTTHVGIEIGMEAVAVGTITFRTDAWQLFLGASLAEVGAYREADDYEEYDGNISKAATGAGFGGYRLGVHKQTGEMVFEASGDGTARVTARSVGALIAPGSAFLLAAVYNAAAGSVTFYRNGVALNTVTGLPTALFANTRRLTIGKWEADA